MRTRHITLSKQQGMITELELISTEFDSAERYMLRYHKPATSSTNVFDFGVSNPRSVSWTGFLYRNNQVSVLLQRQEENS
ncbi:MAG TPA: hypothetical protein VER98_06985 [Terriglobia bacterium]|nr:hypothetical protein [Terriglobia bacterium]